MKRRTFMTTAVALASAKLLLAAPEAASARIGICAFSCHQRWRLTKPLDAIEFYRYGRELGAEGVQASMRGVSPSQLRGIVESSGGYYEADLRLPKDKAELPGFEAEVRSAREAGAHVARTVFTGGRRYEIFKSIAEFRQFHQQAQRSLELVEPVLRRHQLKLAVENHKDHTAEELVSLLKRISSEWIGALVDTGNNIALLDEPHEVIDALAPYALSVHFKDMAVQPSSTGFLLSEIALGAGALDLQRIVKSLIKANPNLVFNLEMATRDPLSIPCQTEAFFETMPDRRRQADEILKWVHSNPPKQAPPSIRDKESNQILADEELNNRSSLEWMASITTSR